MHASRGTRLIVPRAEHHRRNAGGKNRARTHRTRLKGHNEGHTGELPRTQFLGGLADREYLGVRSRIFREFSLIAAAPDYGAVGVNHDRAHRYVIGGEARTRLVERISHVRIEIQTVTTSAVK